MSAPSKAAPEGRAAFVEFVQAHGDSVWRGLHALGVPAASIEDAAQDVFLIAYRSWHRYEERGFARAWLFAISRRVAANLRRQTRSEPSVALEAVPDGLNLEEQMARREARAFLDAFLETLDEPRRLVFYLCEVEGWSAPEVGASLELKLNTVYSRLRRARLLFAAYLERRGGTT
ncbi:MAG: RNA polymerase sigma factor [Nannocystales bacterium]